MIAENMWDTLNNEGYHEDTLHFIVDVWFKLNAVENGFYYELNGSWKLMKTTRGCELLVAIWDGTDTGDKKKKLNMWILLNYIKQSHPIQVAEFVVAWGIENAPVCLVGDTYPEEARRKT